MLALVKRRALGLNRAPAGDRRVRGGALNWLVVRGDGSARELRCGLLRWLASSPVTIS